MLTAGQQASQTKFQALLVSCRTRYKRRKERPHRKHCLRLGAWGWYSGWAIGLKLFVCQFTSMANTSMSPVPLPSALIVTVHGPVIVNRPCPTYVPGAAWVRESLLVGIVMAGISRLAVTRAPERGRLSLPVTCTSKRVRSSARGVRGMNVRWMRPCLTRGRGPEPSGRVCGPQPAGRRAQSSTDTKRKSARRVTVIARAVSRFQGSC